MGEGHFVGTALFMQNRRGHGFGFLEGDEMMSVDGEEKPSIIGTGTEDYFAPARRLYARHGFTECAPFADYVLDPNSVFMELRL